jgi:thioredoxin:protein disulfide reductase
MSHAAIVAAFAADYNVKMIRCGRHWLWLFLWLLMPAVWAASSEPLPADQAFPLKVWATDAQTVVVQWDIQPGYYLYKDRIQISAATPGEVSLGEPRWPAAVMHESPLLGRFPAYEGLTQVTVPLISAQTDRFALQIKYQGCAVKGYCYPPVTQSVTVQHPKETPVRAHYSWMMWLSFFGLGLLISLTPCVLPMIPVLFGLLLGKEHLSHGRAFLISLVYVLGVAIADAVAGVLFGALGGSVQAVMQKPWIIAVFSGVFVAMALSLFGVYSLEPPERFRAWVAGLSHRQRGGSLMGAALMGVLSALILSPCATPPLVAVLTYISQTGNAWMGGMALFVMGLGSGVPLLLIGAFGRRLLPKAGPWMRVVENVLGVILLGVGVWMLGRIIPGRIVLVLWAALAVGVAVYCKTFSAVQTRVQLIGKGLGILIFVYGILLLVGAVQGADSPWQPLSTRFSACPAETRSSFIPVKTVADVQQRMAQAQGQPVLIDFYADWCVSCKLLEQRVFADPTVQKRLSDFLLLRADITANDAEDQALMRYYQVIAPPTVIFFDRHHQESPSRLIGEVSPADFLKHLSEAQ